MNNYETKKQEIEKMFETIHKEVQTLQQLLVEKQTELLKLQGEFRLLEKLEKETKEVK